MADVYIREFCVAAREDTEPGKYAYHVILARKVVGFDGVEREETTTALTPERATEMGFPLSRILEEVNQSAVEQAAKAAEYAQARDGAMEAKGDAEAMKAQAEDRAGKAIARAELISRANDDLQAQLASAQEELRAATEIDSAEEPPKSLLSKLTFGLIK